MGDFGQAFSDEETENEMGWKIKFKRPKFSAPKISVPKIISRPIASIMRPVSSISTTILKNPIAAATTGIAAGLAVPAIAANMIPGVNRLTAPLTQPILSAASPITNAVAPIALMPLGIVSPSAAAAVYQAAMPTQKIPSQVSYEEETLDTTAPSATLINTSPSATLINTSPSTVLTSQGQAVLDTTPAAIVSSSSAKKEEKKGGAGMVIGGLAVAGIAAYMFMKD
jgi:hypothetical protein